MKSLLLSYLTALGTLAILDALWLGVVSREFYKASSCSSSLCGGQRFSSN